MPGQGLPKAFLDLISPLLGDQLAAFQASFLLPPVKALRFSDRRPPPDLEGILQPVPWVDSAYYIADEARLGAHPLHFAGAYYLQDASAMAVAQVLAPRPGSRVLDLCAAPGGKATALASMVGSHGLLLANDLHPARAGELSRNVERMGLANTLVTNHRPAELAQRFPGFFDAILVDAPCSGEGMFRKDPASIQQWTPDAPKACAARQGDILQAAAQMLCPGGRLVYSTCTFNQIENEDVIHAFLASHPAFSLLPIHLKGLAPAPSGFLRLWPHQISGEGHFVALLQKQSSRAVDLASAMQVKQKAWAKEDRQRLDLAGRQVSTWTNGAYLPDAFLGRTMVCLPPGCPDTSGLRVLRLGLHLAQEVGRTLRPDHALALAGKSQKSLSLSMEEAQAYRTGLDLPLSTPLDGYLTPSLQGWPLGWGKAVGQSLKNHYPKGLRSRSSIAV